MSARPAAPKLVFHAVDQARWPDLERLFESRGGPKSCWCMVWRATPAEARTPQGAARKRALALRVQDGTPIGLLGYLGDEPVAWCSIAPKSTYRRLDGPGGDRSRSEPAATTRADSIWSLACFFVTRRLRGQGVTAQLIEAAAYHARQAGATIIEAYPVDPDSPSYRFMGFLPVLEAAGFHPVGRAGTRRHVVQRRLGRAAK